MKFTRDSLVRSNYTVVISEEQANGGGCFPPVPLSREEVLFIRSSVDVIYTVMRLFGFDENGVTKKGTYDHWIYCASVQGSAMSYVKWKIAAFYASVKNTLDNPQEMPPSPCSGVDNVGCLVGGRGYKWIRLLERTDPARYENFALSILYSKKGMPRPGKRLLREAEVKSFYSLTSTKYLHEMGQTLLNNWADIDSCHSKVESFLSEENMRAQLRRTVLECFKGATYDDSDRIKPFFPSTSANYTNSRADGGALGEILSVRASTLLAGLKTKDDVIKIGMEEREMGQAAQPDELLTRFEKNLYHTFSNRKVKYSKPTVDLSGLNDRFMVLYDRMVEEARTEIAYAKLQALPEALKTRVISAGPPLHYTVLKPLQKKLWSTLQKTKCFRLTGQPVDSDNLQDLIGYQLTLLERFLSVDYSDATNQMFSWVSEEIIETLCEVLKISGSEKQLIYESMVNHIIVLKSLRDDKTKKTVEKQKIGVQLNGQLMGSILSFPILCIANAAICRWMLELSNNRPIPLRDAKLAINGDDAVMPCTEKGRIIWEKIGSFCGLRPSVGKVYFSNQFLNINSTTYNYHREGYEGYLGYRKEKDGSTTKTQRIRYFEHVKYVNMGLLLGMRRAGMDKVSTVTSVGNDMSIGTCANTLLSEAPQSLHEILLKEFIKNNKQELTKYSRPWFLPESVCGVGLPSVGTYKACKFDLQVARKIIENPDKFPVPRARPDVPWKVWEYATSRMSKPTTGLLNQREVGLQDMLSYKDLLGKFCIEALFRVELSDLQSEQKTFGDVERSKSASASRLISDIWNAARHDQTIQLGGPLTYFPEPFPDITEIPLFHVIQTSKLL